ncbi:ABC transporter substrate-binding protein [Bifidobacterium sp. ESL0784]|uniref:peptide ABC transporter substrate-binding protein n=1 Tax=Bifidobacterium sp. ESL0784 TaxID=2983231 RepID=UPI0023F62F6D|nr:ABC transporter substrate-binding protein [Bifidobacterium sp. ESL0784]MDF7641145.1 ABC transporter substrate-binding protein [Bifidobacterium sp. ESL0784]
MKKKSLALLAISCSMAMLLGACGSSSSGGNSSAANDHTITAYLTEPNNPLVPGDTNETGGGKPIQLAFSGLIYFDAKGNSKNEVAQSITPNADASQYTIKLKPGWKFSDGSAVTAKTFTRAWSYVANVKNAQKCSSFFSTIKGYDDLQNKDRVKGDEQLSGLKVIDDQTFSVDMAKPDSTFLLRIGLPSFSPLPDAFYKDKKAFGEKPIGNGPYKVDKWDHNHSIKMVKNPYYKGGQTPQNNGITFKIYTTPDSAFADVQSGNLDVMDTIPDSAQKTFQKDSSVKPFNKPGSTIQMIDIPSYVEHFKTGTQEGTLRRRAISMAIDRKAIVDKVLGGLGKPARDFTSPLTPGFNANLKGVENIEYNPKKAKELWNQAEAISHDPNPFTISYNSDGGTKAVFDAIVNSVNNAIGSKVAQTTPIPTNQEFLKPIYDHTMTGAYRAGWAPDYPSAENYLFQNFASAAADGNGSNNEQYKNPKFDQFIDQAYTAKSVDAANKLYSQAQEILLEDLPGIPLYNKANVGVCSSKVKGYQMDWKSQPVYNELKK